MCSLTQSSKWCYGQILGILQKRNFHPFIIEMCKKKPEQLLFVPVSINIVIVVLQITQLSVPFYFNNRIFEINRCKSFSILAFK